jgi:transcriptional regulator with XRE-family HTH domain
LQLSGAGRAGGAARAPSAAAGRGSIPGREAPVPQARNRGDAAARMPLAVDGTRSPELSPKSERRELSAVLAARLRELRARRNLTQDQVAEAIGCHESAVSRWESGSRLPPCTDVLALAELYGVSVDDLLGRREQPALPNSALVDIALLDRLATARTTEEFDAMVEARADQAAWLPVPDGALLVPVADAMRRARQVTDRFPDSRYADRLFRPRG